MGRRGLRLHVADVNVTFTVAVPSTSPGVEHVVEVAGVDATVASLEAVEGWVNEWGRKPRDEAHLVHGLKVRSHRVLLLHELPLAGELRVDPALSRSVLHLASYCVGPPGQGP
jgi:hypothetical protein